MARELAPVKHPRRRRRSANPMRGVPTAIQRRACSAHPAAEVAIVTRANCGIGREVCRQLARRGISVVFTARDMSRGTEAAARVTPPTWRDGSGGRGCTAGAVPQVGRPPAGHPGGHRQRRT